eukprot:CAMPEP_0197468668 /NCGR_PEP_ID=MMETSP1175-20131217/66199_1 /TAXON_ID=1003142 /ORGANISM="Triceratium dubium, Strain CCMP147" /LENGTH=533 /DNA_ID=CAMNT_0043004773 /DNA_START=297 /DNA_END=1895 /DNA_ORIENTATION=-
MAPRERSSLVEVDDENDDGTGYSSYDNCDDDDAPSASEAGRRKNSTSKKVAPLPLEKVDDEEGPSTPLLPPSSEEGGEAHADRADDANRDRREGNRKHDDPSAAEEGERVDADRADNANRDRREGNRKHDEEEEDDDDEEDDCVRKSCFTLFYHLSYIVRLTPKLLKFLFHGTPRWLLKLVRLLLFVACLLPAFVRFGWYYWVSSDRRVVCYRGREEGGCSRHFADVYGSNTPVHHTSNSPSSNGDGRDETLKPVVVFLTGGAWIIGYKMWGALLARALTPFGIIVVIPDYRNFPHARVDGMVDDVDRSVQWTLEHIGHFGGDPNRVVLVGQSAGAHLGSCVVLIRCLMELDPERARELYPKIAERAESYNLSSRSLASSSSEHEPPSIKGFVPVSGPYDSEEEVKAKEDEASNRTIGDVLPPIKLLHGTADGTVPVRECTEFAALLQSACSSSDADDDDDAEDDASCAEGDNDVRAPRIDTLLYDNWSHTDPILEGPFEGDQRFHREVYDLVREWTAGCDDDLPTFDDDHPA